MMISCVDFLPLLVCELLGFASCFFHPISLYTINVSLFRGEMYSEWFVCLLFLFIYFLLLSQSLCFFLSSSRDIRILINCFALLCVRYFDAHFFIHNEYAHSQSAEIVLNQFTLSLLLSFKYYYYFNQFRNNQINLECDKDGIFNGTTIWNGERLEFCGSVIFWLKFLFFVS